MQHDLYIGAILQYNSGSMISESQQVTVSISLYFTWILCIYIILDKGYHILCSHIVGVHLSSDQVTYDFTMDADLHNNFLLRNVSKQLLKKTTYCLVVKCRYIVWAFLWRFFDKFLLFWVFSLSQKPVSSNHKTFTRTDFCFLSVGNFCSLSIFKFWYISICPGFLFFTEKRKQHLLLL